MRSLPSPLLVATDRWLANPPPVAGEGAYGAGGRGGDLSGPSLTRGPPSPLEGGGDSHHRLLAAIEAILAGGARWIWFRERDLAPDARWSLARRIMAIVHEAGGSFTFGGDAGLADVIGADGVHLPGNAIPDAVARARDALPDTALIGVSAHSLGDIEAAARAGADYATLSPVFATASKPGYGPVLGPGIFAEASGYGIPVLALGGITPARARACRDRGAAGIAVMGGVMAAPDPAEATRHVLAAWAR